MKRNIHRRILKIGNKLVEGPSAIFRISEGDWLEKDLQITIINSSYQEIETYSIWSDDSINKQENFLPPMIRILRWNRKEDFEILKENQPHEFPIVKVEIGLIKERNSEKVNDMFIGLQKSFLEYNKYVPYQIPTSRDSAETDINYEQEYLDYLIYFRNGIQSLEFSSSGNIGSKLVDDIIKMKNLLIESIDPVNKNDWKERYYELTEEYLEGKIPEWYYENEIRRKNRS